MSLTVSPTEDDIFEAVRAFLVSVLPDTTEVIQSQVNRVPEPKGEDFVVMTMTSKPRLSTNADSYADSLFTGSMAGDTLTVTSVDFGVIDVGRPVFGDDVLTGTQITARGTGTGGTGTYLVNKAQTVSSEQMAAGVEEMLQAAQAAIQLDFHGESSGDDSQIVTTTFRDSYAVELFPDSVVPLYCDDPRQMPFFNEQQQYENRWVVGLQLQTNQTISIPKQFASAVVVDAISVEAAYPVT